MATDIWFRTRVELQDVGQALTLSGLEYDAENHWEWIIGGLGGVELDITRTHTRPPDEADTRIFRVDRGDFEAEMIGRIAELLRTIALGPIQVGRWVYKSGNDFERVVEQTIL